MTRRIYTSRHQGQHAECPLRVFNRPGQASFSSSFMTQKLSSSESKSLLKRTENSFIDSMFLCEDVELTFHRPYIGLSYGVSTQVEFLNPTERGSDRIVHIYKNHTMYNLILRQIHHLCIAQILTKREREAFRIAPR